MKEKILITGCGGMLGEAVYHQLKNKYRVFATDIDLNESWLSYLDVSNHGLVFKYGVKTKPDFIVHLAALTDMEYCETHPDLAYAVNAGGTKNMVELAEKLGVPLVYISTAGIFDGNKNEYSEEDEPSPPAPLSVYGKSKYAGEIEAKSYPKSIIIRAGWMMGGGPRKDKKFIKKLIQQIKDGSKILAVVKDKLGVPTYTYDLAKTIDHLLEGEHYGLYHGSCDGGGGRHEIAAEIIKHLGLDKKIKIKLVDSEYFKKSYFAPRPASERLSNFKLKTINPGLARDWRECLQEYLEKFDWGV